MTAPNLSLLDSTFFFQLYSHSCAIQENRTVRAFPLLRRPRFAPSPPDRPFYRTVSTRGIAVPDPRPPITMTTLRCLLSSQESQKRLSAKTAPFAEPPSKFAKKRLNITNVVIVPDRRVRQRWVLAAPRRHANARRQVPVSWRQCCQRRRPHRAGQKRPKDENADE